VSDARAVQLALTSHSFRYAARLAFDDVVEDGQEPELLSTDDFDIALVYAEGEC
jgi:hypothetical protein